MFAKSLHGAARARRSIAKNLLLVAVTVAAAIITLIASHRRFARYHDSDYEKNPDLVKIAQLIDAFAKGELQEGEVLKIVWSSGIHLTDAAPLYKGLLESENHKTRVDTLYQIAGVFRRDKEWIRSELGYSDFKLENPPLGKGPLFPGKLDILRNAVVSLLASQSWRTRYNAALALSCLDPWDRRAIPVLVEMGSREDFLYEIEDYNLVVALSKLDPGNKTVSRNLQNLLDDQNAATRRISANLLGILRARDAVETLQLHLDDESQNVRDACARALRDLEGP